MVKGISRVDREKWFELVGKEQRQTRQNTVVNADGMAQRREEFIKKEIYRLEVRKNFFTVRVADVWNRLPVHVKSATNVNMFKTRMDEHLKHNSLGVPQ